MKLKMGTTIETKDLYLYGLVIIFMASKLEDIRPIILDELYNDFCEVLDVRGLLDIEMDNDHLSELVETYWDHFYEDLEESERDNLNIESQKLGVNERFDIYRWARWKFRTIGFECTNCIISRTPPSLSGGL